jgi:hypothetical protein
MTTVTTADGAAVLVNFLVKQVSTKEVRRWKTQTGLHDD